MHTHTPTATFALSRYKAGLCTVWGASVHSTNASFQLLQGLLSRVPQAASTNSIMRFEDAIVLAFGPVPEPEFADDLPVAGSKFFATTEIATRVCHLRLRT